VHQLQAFNPTRNHAADRQVDRAAALDELSKTVPLVSLPV
jgi:hypothetical protein